MEIRTEKIEKIEYKNIYVANDGTEFQSEEECRKYEETATCAIKGMFNTLKMQETYAVGDGEPFNFFYSEDTIHAVKIENADQLEIVNKWIRCKDKSHALIGAEAIGTIQLIVSYPYCNDVWVIGTPDKLKEMYIEGIEELYNELVEKAKEAKGENK